MPPFPQPSSSASGTYGKHRLSTHPPSSSSNSSSSAPTTATTNKQRQLSQLNSQLAQLHAHLSDTEDLVRMTAVQAEHIRALGGIHGALLMSAAKILGEGGAGSSGNSGGAAGSGSDVESGEI